ncbi:MAG TPA: serine/threonine-protein kinase [Burkholderiales bacterium]|nr:serine/threonine-protein kinase [Burkholderiales bacterium]
MEHLRQLGKYRIAEVIGASPLTTVYKATDPEPERTIALKILRKQGIDPRITAPAAAKLKNQLLAAERLAHPGIADVYDHGEDDAVAWLAMEYLAGRGLRDFLTLRLRLGLKDTMSIMAQLLAALDFAHANGVVHRDVKPANIFMLLSGRLKLVDFGIALIDTFDLAQAGAAAGSPAYMAPEQHMGLEADRRSDIFSCGVVLYELLTGSKPFEGAAEAVGEKICREPFRPASELNPKGAPAVLDPVIAQALAKRPEERYPTARDFASALETAFRETGETHRPDASDAASRTLRPDDGTVQLSASLSLGVGELRAVETLLTLRVGPMAKLLLKQAARIASDGPALVAMLAKYVPNEADRNAFVAAATEKMAASVPPESAEQSPTVRFSRNLIDAPQVEIAGKRLARYVGPIAKVIAKKTPGRPADLRAYYRQLAENIADPADRERFLADAGYAK